MRFLFLLYFCVPFFAYGTTTPTTTLTLQDKIDQLFIIGFHDQDVHETSEIRSILEQTNLGGVILFEQDSTSTTRNIYTPTQLRTLTTDLQKYARSPLFISIDEEGGAVRALKQKQGFVEILKSAFWYNAKPKSTIYKDSFRAATYIHSFGINMNFAPVVDLRVNAKNPIIAHFDRSFSRYPSTVIRLATSFIEAYTKANIITSLKHFPGHGSSTTDSHKSFTDVTHTYSKSELVPFQKIAGINKVPMVMMSHVFDQNVDTNFPASLSPAHVKNLRNTGFTGVIITDDMDMQAIKANYTREQAVTQALIAGNDMLIISFFNTNSSDEFLTIRQYVMNAVNRGDITEKMITEKYNRVMALKKKYKIID